MAGLEANYTTGQSQKHDRVMLLLLLTSIDKKNVVCRCVAINFENFKPLNFANQKPRQKDITVSLKSLLKTLNKVIVDDVS